MGQEPDQTSNAPAARGGRPAIRASDRDREAVAARLNAAAGDGTLTLPEFSERLDRTYAARTRGELAPLTADLPAPDPALEQPGLRRVMLGIFWDSRLSGAQPLADEITAIALLGDAVIDLRGATATSHQITIHAYALLNDVDVIVPAGVTVELSGVTVVGDFRNMVSPVPAAGSGLVVKIHGHALLGDVQIFHRNPRAVHGQRRRSIESRATAERTFSRPT